MIRGYILDSGILHRRFKAIIRKAGFEPWPRLFNNLRSSRETELSHDWPMHIVCKWIGNSVPVAREHYLQVRDEDYAKAASEESSAIRGAHSVTTDHTASQEQGHMTSCDVLQPAGTSNTA